MHVQTVFGVICIFYYFFSLLARRENDGGNVLESWSPRNLLDTRHGWFDFRLRNSLWLGSAWKMFELDHSNDQEISCYRLQWPILEFQSVKGVHIRSCEAGNVLSSFRCSIGGTISAVSRAEKCSPFYVWLSTRISLYSTYVATKNLSSLKYRKYAWTFIVELSSSI